MRKNYLYWLLFALVVVLVAGWVARNRADHLSFAASGVTRVAKLKPLSAPQAVRDIAPASIVLSASAQAHLGVEVSEARAAHARQRVSLPATVAPVIGLVSLVETYQAAGAQLRKAQIVTQVAKREYERLEKLYNDQRNASAKAVEAQQGIYRSDEVDVRAARQTVALALASIRQNWGTVVEQWAKRDSVTLRDILSRRDVLVEVTLPFGTEWGPPPFAALGLPEGGEATAKLISPFPQVDPRVQGTDFLYLTQARPGLVPGVNLVARFGVGRRKAGVFIPSSAVIWQQGQAWAYVKITADRFERRPVATQIPMDGGWFEARHFRAGEQVVTQGAEELLAIEANSADRTSEKE